MFAPIPETVTTVERCEEALRRSILSRRFAPGERLPAERKLAAQFGVNRVTVRSALGRLEAAGVVKARQGSGYTVREFLEHGGPSLLPGIVALARERGETTDVIRDLLLVRRHLAQAVLTRLAQGPLDPSRLDAFDAAVDRFAAVVDAPDAEVGEADLGVLAALLSATGSAVLALCLNPVSALVRDLPELRRAIYADPASNLAGWRALGGLLRSPALREDPASVLDAVAGLLAARDVAALALLEAQS